MNFGSVCKLQHIIQIGDNENTFNKKNIYKNIEEELNAKKEQFVLLFRADLSQAVSFLYEIMTTMSTVLNSSNIIAQNCRLVVSD